MAIVITSVIVIILFVIIFLYNKYKKNDVVLSIVPNSSALGKFNTIKKFYCKYDTSISSSFENPLTLVAKEVDSTIQSEDEEKIKNVPNRLNIANAFVGSNNIGIYLYNPSTVPINTEGVTVFSTKKDLNNPELIKMSVLKEDGTTDVDYTGGKLVLTGGLPLKIYKLNNYRVDRIVTFIEDDMDNTLHIYIKLDDNTIYSYGIINTKISNSFLTIDFYKP